MGQGLLIHEVFTSHTTTHHSRWETSGRVISSSQRPLPDNKQHSQQTACHAPLPGGIRTHNISRRAAADVSLRPDGHWDQFIIIFSLWKICLLHASAEMGHRQVMYIISRYTKKNYSTLSCLNSNEKSFSQLRILY